MPQFDFDAIFYIQKPPEIVFSDGLYRFGYAIGRRARFEVVMSPSTFNKAMLLAEDARASATVAGLPRSNVTPLRKK